MRRRIAAPLLLFVVLAGCTDGGGSGDGSADRTRVAPGGSLEVVYPDGTQLGTSYVLKDGSGKATYLLMPRMAGKEPSYERITSSEYAQTMAQLPVEDGAALEFRLPPGLDEGDHEICASSDVCINIRVT